MREQLKNLTEKDYWVYGISESDFDHALTLVTEMIQARNEQYEVEAAKVRQESPDVAEDILDDVAYYRYTDNQYLWQFVLWRLQGLIEAVIAHQFVETQGAKKLFGLKAKLESLTAIGYTITAQEIEELLSWAGLRNAISHAPPEQYRPVSLTKDDIVEYHQFVKGLYLRWKSEKSAMPVV
ncbi:hypothetical protein BCU83_13700 [Vibrio breoganii]|uniref:hypothetical protein n=1 Tax=Vibrio breoganii TaxID=553239 RepID=UPI000C834C4D|nr:hypothetical protein [Vibrio breoganii]PMG79268.1 hypothetical protein BCU83_13700 [Vibrio breoganii]